MKLRIMCIMCSMIALAIGSFSAPSLAQCGEGAGSCLEIHGTPGCVVVECCTLVCDQDPQCCDTDWDENCVLAAGQLCDGLTCPSPGSCVEVHWSAGCADADCCHAICAIDAVCCFTAWDSICVEEAQRLCGVGMCTIEIPTDAVSEDEPCYDHINDGCNNNILEQPMIDVAIPATRTGKYATGSPRDTDWYRFTINAPRRVRMELTAEFPGQLLLVQGACYGPIETLAQSHGNPCVATAIETCLDPGTYMCVVSGGVPSRSFRDAFTCDEIDPDAPPPDPKDPPPVPSPYGLRYVLRLSAGGCLVGDLNGDGTVGQTDLAILLGSWGGAGAADLDGDGIVGSADLAILLGAWSG